MFTFKCPTSQTPHPFTSCFPSLCRGCLLIGHACLFPSNRSILQLQVQVGLSSRHILYFQISCFVADSTNDSAVLASDSPTSSSWYFAYSLLSYSKILGFLVELLKSILIILHSLAAAPSSHPLETPNLITLTHAHWAHFYAS